MDELDNVYQSLKAAKLCKSKYAFSRDYLGRAPNYYSSIKATNTKPSTHALMTLYFRLSELSDRLNEANHPRRLQLSNLSSKVFADVWHRCYVGELNYT
jgi:Family of unknown function (DUF6626)